MEGINKRSVINLVSVVIPCYNHGTYLAAAIESILNQSYKQTEVIVVDDGSTDNTKLVASNYQEVIYIYQENRGLSAARNTGIDHASGEFLVFLDADDWLIEQALEINSEYLKQNYDACFVSGAYKIYYEDRNLYEDKIKPVSGSHYVNLLQGNYISMVAAVMFRKSMLEHFRFDETLKVCEDYDVYLRLTRRYRVIHHSAFMAAYRFHGNNISYQYRRMLETSLFVLYRQKSMLSTHLEEEAFQKGVRFWKEYYSREALKALLAAVHLPLSEQGKDNVALLLKYNKKSYFKYKRAQTSVYIKNLLKIKLS